MTNQSAPQYYPDVTDTISIGFDRIGLRYGRGEEILSDVNFVLQKGSMNFVTGPSGSGKTSLLKLIYLNMRPSRGLITLFGQDTSQLEKMAIPLIKRRMGIVLQDFMLIDHLNVYENVALPLRILGNSREDYHEDILSLLSWVGLGKRQNAFPTTLSAGEKQRAAIARALIVKPEILVADEPTGNVDKEIGARLIRLFSEMNRLGTTVIIATHDRALIPNSADILYLQSGTVIHKRGDDV
ncbi:MAG: ATP-binding cassette domain-containing protein [Robiginitomaculum sp.]